MGERINMFTDESFNNKGFSAEPHAYSYAYNEGHSDSRKDDGYNPIKSKQGLVDFKRILKQKAESFSGEKGYVIYSLGYNEGEQGKGRKSPESFVSMIAKFNDIENSHMLSDDDDSYTIYTIGYFDGESDKINKRTPQAFALMLSKMGKSYGKPLLSSIPKTARLDAESKKNCGCGQDPCKTYGAEDCEHFWEVARDGENYNRCLNCGITNERYEAENSYCHNHKTCGGYRVQGTFLCWPCHDIEADIRIAKRNDAESFEATKGIDTFTEPFEEIGVPKWLIGIGGVVAAITGIKKKKKKL